MAHGYYRVSGKPAAVMVHVTVGTANAICALMNAARDNAARSFCAPDARRSPRPGMRLRATARSIGARKCSIRAASPANSSNGTTSCAPANRSNSVVDRALDIAMSEPRGPVYLTLPREVLADDGGGAAPRYVASAGGDARRCPSLAAIEQAAAILAAAEFPLLLTSSAGRTPEAMAELAALAEEFALPVVQSEARDISLPTDHPMCLGFDPGPLLAKADAVAVFDSAVPWIPRLHPLRAGRQGDLLRSGPAVHALSVPRIRGRPAGDGRVRARRSRCCAKRSATP